MTAEEPPMPDLTPPVEFAHFRWHWLWRYGSRVIVPWDQEARQWISQGGIPTPPSAIFAAGWRYHKPCDPDAISPPPAPAVDIEPRLALEWATTQLIDSLACAIVANGDQYEFVEETAHRLILSALRSVAQGSEAPPIDAILFCPVCGCQHVDAPDGDWTNPPHRSHLCAGCGAIWRPADVATNGVQAIKSEGSADTVSFVDGGARFRRDVEAVVRAPEVVALATAFKLAWDGNAGRISEKMLDAFKIVGLCEQAENGFVSVTPVGRKALALAKGDGG